MIKTFFDLLLDPQCWKQIMYRIVLLKLLHVDDMMKAIRHLEPHYWKQVYESTAYSLTQIFEKKNVNRDQDTIQA